MVLHATGDPVIKIKLNPIAVGAHGHVLFSTYKYANSFGSNSYNKHEFGWLVVHGRTGEWDEREAYNYNGKDKSLYEKYLHAKIGLKNPDKVLKALMDKYFFSASSTLNQSSFVYAIKANQSCFDSECTDKTTVQKTLGEKKSKVLYAPIRSSFYYGGVALFHNNYNVNSDIEDSHKKPNEGAVFDFKQEVYIGSDDANPHLYPYSEVDGLVLFDPFRFSINTKINLSEIRKQIDYCESNTKKYKNSKHEKFKQKNIQWDICTINKNSKIITIEYTQEETKNKRYKELYVVNHEKLQYAFEQESDSREGQEWIWNCQFAIIDETQAEVLSSLGHGKTEDDNWDANEIIEMYKNRMRQLKVKR